MEGLAAGFVTLITERETYFAGIVLLGVVLLFKGELIPKKTLDGRLADRDKIIENLLDDRKVDKATIETLLGGTSVTNKLLGTLESKVGGGDNATPG